MADNNFHLPARRMGPEDWQRMKPEIYRLYIVENKPMDFVQAQLQKDNRFQACISSWKAQVKEWKFSKNFSAGIMHSIVAVEAQRAQKRKRTAFDCEGTPITQERIENFKKRHCQGIAPPSVPALPSNIRYHTPISEDDGDSIEEEINEKLPVYFSTSTQVPSSSHRWDKEPSETYKIDLPDEPRFSSSGSIDRWLLNKHQPWSHLELFHQLNYHDDTVVNDRNLSAEFGEFGLLSDEYDLWLDLPSNVFQPFLESRSLIVVEQDDTVSEDAALKYPSTFATKLTKYLRRNTEYTPQALTVGFDRAEALIQTGKYNEAEDHCGKLIAIDSPASVATLLGTIFARTGSLEESTTWLFIALAHFILDWTKYSFQQNEQLYFRIDNLFGELLWLVEQDWAPLTETMEEMMVTIKGLRSDEDIHRAYPEFFIHGFHFAHNCTTLKLVNSAKYMYQHLLEPSNFYLNGRHFGEKANAHQMYGLLLSGEENWSLSAEQLLLACDSTIQSGAYTHQNAAVLTITFDLLRIHLPSENDRPGSTVKMIETKLEYMKNQISVSHNGFSVLPVENYLQSNLPGLRCAISLAGMSVPAQLTLPVRSIVPSQGRTNSNSIFSRRGKVSGDARVGKKSASSGPMSSVMSGDGSHENGQTWPTSEWDEYAGINSICDRMSYTS